MEKLVIVLFAVFVCALLVMNENRYHTVKYDYYICEDLHNKTKTNPITKKDLLTLKASSVESNYSCTKHSMTRREVHVITKMRSGDNR